MQLKQDLRLRQNFKRSGKKAARRNQTTTRGDIDVPITRVTPAKRPSGRVAVIPAGIVFSRHRHEDDTGHVLRTGGPPPYTVLTLLTWRLAQESRGTCGDAGRRTFKTTEMTPPTRTHTRNEVFQPPRRASRPRQRAREAPYHGSPSSKPKVLG